MNNKPCKFDDNLTCSLEICTPKCPKNIYYKREDNNDKKINQT